MTRFDASAIGRAPDAHLGGRERAALALFALSGAAFLPGALDRFVFPKLALAAAAAAIALATRPRGSLPRSVVVLLTGAAMLLGLGALEGAAPLAQLVGRAPRYEGVVGLSIYLGALVAGARLLGPARAPGALAWLLDVLTLATLAVGLESLLEAIGLRPLVADVSRPGSLLGNASDQGAWALLAIGPLAAAGLMLRQRLYAVGAAAAAVTLIASGSRGALLGVVVVAAALAGLRPGRRGLIVLVVGLVLVAAGVLALPTTRARVLGTSALAQHTATGRLALASETGRLVLDHPWLGVGPSGYVDAIPADHDAAYERDVGPQDPPDSPHDWVLQAAAAGGVGLALLAIALAALTGVRGVRRIAATSDGDERVVLAGLLAGLAGYTAALLFHFTGPGTTPLAALFAGALLSTGARGRVIARRGSVAIYTALSLAMAAAAVAEVPLRRAFIQAAAGDLPAAQAEFAAAHRLRPWDPGIDQLATHAYAVLATHGVPGAATKGLSWAAAELRAFPASVQALQDEARLDQADGRPGAAARALQRARRLDPANPTLSTQ